MLLGLSDVHPNERSLALSSLTSNHTYPHAMLLETRAPSSVFIHISNTPSGRVGITIDAKKKKKPVLILNLFIVPEEGETV